MDVVGGDDIAGSEEDGLVVGGGAAGTGKGLPRTRIFIEYDMRLRPEVVEVLDSQNGGRKVRGQAQRRRWRKMLYAVHLVGVHLGLEGLFHLTCAEARGELIGAEPLVIERRSRVLLRGDQRFQIGFLLSGAIEDDGDSVDAGAGGQAAGIELRLSMWVKGACNV